MAINPPVTSPCQIRSLLGITNTSTAPGYWEETTTLANNVTFAGCIAVKDHGAAANTTLCNTIAINNFIMWGLGSAAPMQFTPTRTGNILVAFSWPVANVTGVSQHPANSSALYNTLAVYGTGTGPGAGTLMSASNAQFIGGSSGPIRNIFGGSSFGCCANKVSPAPQFSFFGILQGLSLGTKYYFDLTSFLTPDAAGHAAINGQSGVTTNIFEL